jgi:hypothetical protein
MSWNTNYSFPYRIQMQQNILDCQSPKTGKSFHSDPVLVTNGKGRLKSDEDGIIRIFILYSLCYFLYFFPSLALFPPLSYFLLPKGTGLTQACHFLQTSYRCGTIRLQWSLYVLNGCNQWNLSRCFPPALETQADWPTRFIGVQREKW